MDWSNKTVLIAEDEDANFLLLAEYLESTGIQIIRACNGFEVLEICKSKLPDLILMDMKMPRMTGYEAVKLMRQSNIQTPIIAQTAYTMVGDEEKTLAAGCNDYLGKPISEDSLIQKIKKYF
jgi:CheY-like chemotaxis protein